MPIYAGLFGLIGVALGYVTRSTIAGSMWQRAGYNRVTATTFWREAGGDGDM